MTLRDQVGIRSESPEDRDAVHAVNVAAFGSEAEAELVDNLRARAPSIISLVAEVDDRVVGHIMFSPMQLSADPTARVAGLAPMAVLPEVQRRSIGSVLVSEGLVCCRDHGFGAVCVLGHPTYYPRFGFVPADEFGIVSTYEDVPTGAFMALELVDGFLDGRAGVAAYHPVFEELVDG